jgi:hypothetical protein
MYNSWNLARMNCWSQCLLFAVLHCCTLLHSTVTRQLHAPTQYKSMQAKLNQSHSHLWSQALQYSFGLVSCLIAVQLEHCASTLQALTER